MIQVLIQDQTIIEAQEITQQEIVLVIIVIIELTITNYFQ